MKSIFFLFLSFSMMLQAQVYIDSAYVETEFCGPFNKTILNFKIINRGSTDSLNGVFIINTNKSVFVKELWLDIDGKYKQAINLKRRTAERIYDRILGTRRDPSLLRKLEDGVFQLQVFPVTVKAPRFIKIEFYSFIELTKEPKIFNWKIEIQGAKKISTAYKMTLPVGFDVKDYKGANLDRTQLHGTLDNTSTTLNCGIELLFDLNKADSILTLFNDDWSFDFKVNDQEYRKFTHLPSTIYSFPEYFKTVINYSKESQYLFSLFPSKHKQVSKFHEYMLNIKGVKIYSGSLLPTIEWKKSKSLYTFLSKYKTSFSELTGEPHNNRSAKNINLEKIECNYLNEIAGYIDELTDTLNQGYTYLTKQSAKLVLEDNDFTNRIYEEEISAEINDLKSDKDEEPYSMIEEFPKYPGGIEALMKYIQENLFYPSSAKSAGIQGKVFTKLEIEDDGTVSNANTVKGIDSACDNEAERVLSLMDNWIPSKVPKRIAMIIPINFVLRDDSVSNFGIMQKDKFVKYKGKTFEHINDQKFFEQGFDHNNFIAVKHSSKEYYNILYANPLLIDYVYYLQNVGIYDTISKNWIHFE